MRTIILFAIVFASSTSAQEHDFDLTIENFTKSSCCSRTVVKIKNTTQRSYRSVSVDCVFKDKNGRAIDIGLANIRDLSAGETAYEKAGITQSAGVASVSCSVVRAY